MAGPYYWVGGSGNTSDATNHWATSSGGTPNAANTPSSTDDVNWDSSSNGSDYTVTVDATFACRDFTLGAPATGKVTFAGSVGVNFYGNINLSGGSSGITWTHTGSKSFVATSSKTITINGVSTTGDWDMNGVGGTYTLQDTWSGTGAITLSAGTLDVSSRTITCGLFGSGGSTTRTLTITNATINCTSWSINNTTGLTFNISGSTINCDAGSAIAKTEDFNTLTYAAITVKAYAGVTTAISGTITCTTFAITNNTGVDTRVTLSGNITCSTSNTFTSTDQASRIYIASSSRGTARTITSASVSMTDVMFEDITGAGAGSWTGTRVGNCGGNSGITFTTPVTRYWVGNGGNASDTAHWSTSSGGSTGASVPLPQDTAIVDASSFSSGSQTLTIDFFRIGNWDFAGVDSSPALTITASSFFYGDFLMDAGLGTVTTGAQTFRGRTQTIHLAGGGKSFSGNVTFDTLSTNLIQLSGAFITSGLVNLTSGSFNMNNFNCSCTSLVTSNSNTRSITSGTGTFNATGTGNILNTSTSTGLTVNFTGGTFKVSDASSSVKTFIGSGKTWGTLWWAVGTGTGNCDLTGSNTFAGIQDTGTAAHSLRFTAGTTTTITSTTFPTGDASHTITIASITAAGHTLTLSGGGTVSCDYMSISRSTASPGTTWYAGTHSTDGGNNSGWVFTAPPGGSNIKTVLGLAIASVKTVNGLAIASVKNFDGLA